jgi:mono/diheme cytochrome c family protein
MTARLPAFVACSALALLPLCAEEPAPAPAAAPEPAPVQPAPLMEPGLTLTFTAGGQTDTRRARLVALAVPERESTTPFLPVGPFTATWEGQIAMEMQTEVSFAVEVQGSVKVSLNGEKILEGNARTASQPVKLLKGANKLTVEFTSPENADSLVRLLWSSRDFPWEPVPPTVFTYDAHGAAVAKGEQLRLGRLLFAERRCVACHDAQNALPPPGQGMPELAQGAPLFADLHKKFREPWLAAWINDPHRFRPQSAMPRVFTKGDAEQIDQRASDVAAYFASLGPAIESKPPDASLVPQGGAIFASLGCIACHSRPDAEGKDPHGRTPLAHIREKWQVPALIDYLRDPQKNYAWSRMPHFRLTANEAVKLTAYLYLNSKKPDPAGSDFDLPGDAKRGAQLLTTSGCLNCHAGVPPTTTPTLASTLKNGWTTGCVAPDAATRGGAPDFAFTPEQREALKAFAASGFGSLQQDVAIEFAERQMTNLRCQACHSRDGQPSLWAQLDDEAAPLAAAVQSEGGEGSPIATTALPPLTWTGEKLLPVWLTQFIAGHGKEKPRPWMVGRMPGFPAVAEGIAEGLVLEHGFPLALPPIAVAPDPAKIKAGETLIGENGGFNCLQCHALDARPATAPFEAPGPNLTLAANRLRADYFHRWVLYPTRIEPDTKMPRFADESGKTPLGDLLGGEAKEQYDAIWLYLQSLKKPVDDRKGPVKEPSLWGD